MDKKVFLNTTYQVIGKVLITLFAVITTALLTRYLGTNGFSEYSLIFSFIEIVAIIPNFGIVTLLMRELPKKNDTFLFYQMLSLRILLSIASFTIAIILLPFFPYSLPIKIGIGMATLYGLFMMGSGIYWAAVQSKLEFGKIVVVQIITAVIGFIGVMIGVYFKWPLLYFVASNIVSVGIGFIISVKISEFRLIFPRVSKQYIHDAVRKTFPFALWTIFGLAYFKIDSIILSIFYPPGSSSAVGIYALSYKVFEVLIVLTGYLPQTLFPIFSKLSGSEGFSKFALKNFYLTLFVSVISSVGLYIFSPLFIQILGGKQFSASILPSQILSPAIGFSIVASFFMHYSFIHHKEKQIAYVGAVALVLNLVMNFIFIPKGSYIAAAWTTIITQFFVMVGDGVVVLKIIKKHD
jgi:O-antigen/teichoic acid export membrane protein